jgi:hypothetical protein
VRLLPLLARDVRGPTDATGAAHAPASSGGKHAIVSSMEDAEWTAEDAAAAAKFAPRPAAFDGTARRVPSGTREEQLTPAGASQPTVVTTKAPTTAALLRRQPT